MWVKKCFLEGNFNVSSLALKYLDLFTFFLPWYKIEFFPDMENVQKRTQTILLGNESMCFSYKKKNKSILMALRLVWWCTINIMVHIDINNKGIKIYRLVSVDIFLCQGKKVKIFPQSQQFPQTLGVHFPMSAH